MFGVDDKDSNFDGSTIDIRDGIIPKYNKWHK
jgi:hypothetical protein